MNQPAELPKQRVDFSFGRSDRDWSHGNDDFFQEKRGKDRSLLNIKVSAPEGSSIAMQHHERA